MPKPQKSLLAKARAARQATIIANSAVASMLRAAAATNPDKMLRCWSAEQRVRNVSKRGTK